MLKQAFRQCKELQKKVGLLSNIFSNRLNDLVNSSDEEDVINQYHNKNAMSPQLPAIVKNKVVNYSKSK